MRLSESAAPKTISSVASSHATSSDLADRRHVGLRGVQSSPAINHDLFLGTDDPRQPELGARSPVLRTNAIRVPSGEILNAVTFPENW